MREQLKQKLIEAQKAKETRTISTLRLVLATIKDRDIAARSHDNMEGVSDSEILQILAKMIKQRNESVETYEKAGREDLASQEREEIDIIQHFLPKQMDEGEIRAAVEKTIAKLEASSIKDMGRVMGELKEQHGGEMDFAKAGMIVKIMLGQEKG
ncbi:MAG: GatB/YqeY domain-containing protein [Parvibaculales bacterium]